MIRLYSEMCEKYGVKNSSDIRTINAVIKNALKEFTEDCVQPAIWCYGNHTKMLMADFVYELRKVKYIIDNNLCNTKGGGYVFINEDSIEDTKIDGIIISSYKYRNQIKAAIRKNNLKVKYLDIYDVLEQNGISLSAEYYNASHPYEIYKEINRLKRQLAEYNNPQSACVIYESIIYILIYIKDFVTAKEYAEDFLQIQSSKKMRQIYDDLEQIYNMQLEGMGKISKRNVLMLCIDGLRRRDVLEGLMPELWKYIGSMLWFENAYSISTSTYESLIPAYSENLDMRTKYYEKNLIQEEDCRFVKEAIKQDRNIYFYTDAISYIDSSKIKIKGQAQTASEKLWDFLLDAVDEDNGLFYVHLLYESHFSYPNPYTETEIVAEGTSIFFDFLNKNKGGAIMTDYNRQHEDSLKYLDHILAPLINKLNINMVLYADHGNVILKPDMTLQEISYPMLTFGKELLEVPLAIKSPVQKSGRVSSLVSLADINDIVISLMHAERYQIPDHAYVKAQRSEVYNPDYKYIYKSLGFDKGMQAFEIFIFEDKYKLVVYRNKEIELYDADDERISDIDKCHRLYDIVKNYITLGSEDCGRS